jgi:hypothetical protein
MNLKKSLRNLGKGDNMATLSPKDLAEAWDSDPKTVRRFLRSLASDRPGKGGRWIIEAEDLKALQESWNDWNSSRAVIFSFADAEAESYDEEFNG